MTPLLDLPIAHIKIPLSVLQAPNVELKPLSEHLKYIFLAEWKTLPVITSNKLNQSDEEKLVRVLHEYNEAIVWMIADIK